MTLTDAAAARVRELTEAAGKPIAGLRVGVRNGGCAGMSYTMELAESASPRDEVVEDKGVRLLIDPKAVLFLLGSQMDFKVDRLSATFSFANPNETGLRLRRERRDHAGEPRSALEAQRDQGKKPYDAIYQGCMLRFRPIMMTTVAALFGTMPIALGYGEGADARQPLGLAVVGGLVLSRSDAVHHAGDLPVHGAPAERPARPQDGDAARRKSSRERRRE